MNRIADRTPSPEQDSILRDSNHGEAEKLDVLLSLTS